LLGGLNLNSFAPALFMAISIAVVDINSSELTLKKTPL
jgi:hypothetical protein